MKSHNSRTKFTIEIFDNFVESDQQYRFLSNFYRMKDSLNVTFLYGIYKAFTVEHIFQAMKTTDLDERKSILNARTPGEAKKLGRRCNLRIDWESVKIQAMRACLETKFTTPSNLAPYDTPAYLGWRLINTYPYHLRECNIWRDAYWGVDLSRKDKPGMNMLGMLLTDIRSRLLDNLA